MKLYVIGYPSRLGGADTELDHQIRCWQSIGIQVHLIPTGPLDENLKSLRMEDRGCIVHAPCQWKECKGSTVISYCNSEFLTRMHEIKEYAKTTLWVNCMCWLFPDEKKAHKNGLIDLFIYQTDHAREKVQNELISINPKFKWKKIRPYFYKDEFPYIKNRPNDRFRFGRISREDADKFHPAQLWVYETMVSPNLKDGLILGINGSVRKKIGIEPDWIKGYPAGGMSAQKFYEHTACVIQMCDNTENLPRIGFEAMSSGSLLIVDNRGGWKEQIQHRQTGYLCNDQREFAYYASRSAYELDERRKMTQNARDWLETNWGLKQAQEEWISLFNDIGS